MNELAVKEEIRKEVETFNQQALSMQIVDAESYTQAAQLWTSGKSMIKVIEGFFKPLKQAQDKAKQAILDKEKEEIEKVKPGLDYINKIQSRWNIEQEAIRKAEEDRLRAEARKKEEEDRLAAALEAEAEGETKEVVEEILDTPSFTPPPIVEKSVPKVAGQTMTTTWRWRLTNINLVPRQFLIVNEVALNAHVKNLKDRSNVPGVEVYPEQSMRSVRT